MSKHENISYPKSPHAAAQGLGYKREFLRAAQLTLAQRRELTRKNWGFETKQNAIHEFAHDLLFLAARIPPQTKEMQRITYAPEYQGNMITEPIIIAAEEIMQGMIMDRRALSLEEIKKSFELITKYYAGWLKDQGDKGNKAAFWLGRQQNRHMFDVRKDFAFDDNRTLIEATLQIGQEFKSQSWWGKLLYPKPLAVKVMRNIKDGDQYTAEGEINTYREMKPIDVSDPTYDMIIDRMATVI